MRLFASTSNWIEGAAIDQLCKATELPGVEAAVGMPDLHPGKGIPVGAAIYATGQFYPHLIGNDVGCGIGLWQTEVACNKLKIDKWLKKLSLDGPWHGDREQFCREHGLGEWSDALGTIGGGNHFAELQRVETIFEPEAAATLGLEPRCAQLMVHSGSRGLGEMILRSHTDVHGGASLPEDSEAGIRYLARHDDAVRFAQANRALIATRFLDAIRTRGIRLADAPHNYLCRVEAGWLHRKGAAPSDRDFALVPGSRGSFSYLVQPLRHDADHLWSLAHGAGRRWNRSSVKDRLSGRHSVDSLRKTKLGSRVICNDKALLFQEAPEAYKDVEVVVGDMVATGLIKVVAKLRPLLTYKTAGGSKWH